MSKPPASQPATHQTSLLIATPAMDGLLDYRYTAALLQTFDLLRQNGIAHTVTFEVGNSLIADARNRLASGFLASSYTDLLFIDADIAWQPADVLRLLSWNVPVVGGVYQRKSETRLDFTVKFGPRIEGRGELMTAERVGTGFLRLRRDCLQALVTAHPEWQLTDERDPATPYYALFDTGIINGSFVGEDFMFCDRWRQLGGEVLVDPGITLQHIGSKAFTAQLRDYLTPNKG